MEAKTKYIAYKLRDLPPWLWFEVDKVKEENGRIIATGGWGADGALTTLNCDDDLVIGRIWSDIPMYSDN